MVEKGQDDRKNGAFTHRALYFNPAALRVNQLLRNGKPEARAFARGTFMARIVALEQMRQRFGGNARAVVGNGDMRFTDGSFCTNLNMTARRGMADRIIDEVFQRLAAAEAVAENDHAVGGGKR